MADPIECHNEIFLRLNTQNSFSALYSKEPNIKMFKEKVKNFYRICVSYLNQWDEIEGFAIYNMIMILLDAIPCGSTIGKSLAKLIKIRSDLNINNNEIFDEFTYLKNYANAEQI